MRVYVVVEGQTEESFVKTVLAPSLGSQGVYLAACLLGKPGHKGGNVVFERLRKDVVKLLKQHQTSYCTTFLDFFRLGQDFPGRRQSALTSLTKALNIEAAMTEAIAAEIPDLEPRRRFRPYIQLHEFEALLFSAPRILSTAIGGSPRLAASLQEVRSVFLTPEDINDSPETAPSKRLIQHCPDYDKVLNGSAAAQSIGLPTMERECPHFREWLIFLRSLAPIS